MKHYKKSIHIRGYTRNDNNSENLIKDGNTETNRNINKVGNELLETKLNINKK